MILGPIGHRECGGTCGNGSCKMLEHQDQRQDRIAQEPDCCCLIHSVHKGPSDNRHHHHRHHKHHHQHFVATKAKKASSCSQKLNLNQNHNQYQHQYHYQYKRRRDLARPAIQKMPKILLIQLAFISMVAAGSAGATVEPSDPLASGAHPEEGVAARVTGANSNQQQHQEKISELNRLQQLNQLNDDNNYYYYQRAGEPLLVVWPHRHQKRHLVASEGAHGATEIVGTNEDKSVNIFNAPEYHKLIAFWTLLRSSYPTLCSYLFNLATTTSMSAQSGRQQQQQNQNELAFRTKWITNPQIEQLLGEADQLARERHLSSTNGDNQQQQQQQQQHQDDNNGDQLVLNPQLPGWLSRVNLSPSYARLVQHLRAKQRAGASLGLGIGAKPLLRPEPSESSSVYLRPLMVPSATPSPPPPPPPSDGEKHVYGRLVHHPAEIGPGAETSSAGMARTLDKLHLLNQQNRFNQQQQSTLNSNEIPPPSPIEQAAELESNRIQLAGQELGSQTNSDSARNQFVYGDVLLRPNQNDNRGREPQHLGSLRQLANEERGIKQQQYAASSQSGSDSYGRVIVSPPSSSSSSSSGSSTSGTSGTGSTSNYQLFRGHHQQQQHNQKQQYANKQYYDSIHQSQKHFGETKASSLDRLRQQLDPNQLGLSSVGGGDGGPSQLRTSQRTDDELASQQRAQQMAADEEPDDEFAGEFHSGPLVQSEVRQLRSLDSDKKQQQQPVTLTTNKPGDVFVVD